eukprot:SAG11_NODE_3188_length_2623_cov_11.721078_3_plen_108_part_00
MTVMDDCGALTLKTTTRCMHLYSTNLYQVCAFLLELCAGAIGGLSPMRTSDLDVLTWRDHQCTLELNEVAGLLTLIPRGRDGLFSIFSHLTSPPDPPSIRWYYRWSL